MMLLISVLHSFKITLASLLSRRNAHRPEFGLCVFIHTGQKVSVCAARTHANHLKKIL